MINKKRNQHGATLVETILVLAITGMIVILGIRQYRSYRQSSEINQLKQTVDIIFQGMSDYYKANCFGQYNPVSNTYRFDSMFRNTNGGPANPPLSVRKVAMDTSLRSTNARYINITNAQFFSPLINNISTSTFEHGFNLQFNKYYTDAYVCIEGTNATGTELSTGCIGKQKIGTVVAWKAVVSVRPSSAITARVLQNLSGATCVSSAMASGAAWPCGSTSAGSTFVTWERDPMAATEGTVSTYVPTMSNLKAFTQMYRADNITHLTTTQPSATGTDVNYIYCIN